MDISIPSFREISNENGTFYVYSLHIRYEDWEHIVEKRYSEFLELHKVLKMISIEQKLPLPSFPKKKYWTRITGKSEEQLEERRNALENYMREVSSSTYAHSCKFFIEFLCMPVRLRDRWARDWNLI